MPEEFDRTLAASGWIEAMLRGDFDSAWTINDRVLAARDARTRDDPSRPYHERWVWDGRAVDDRAVLVRCYHGLGDTIQFSRYLLALGARAASVTVEVQPSLIPVLSGFQHCARVMPFACDAPLPPAECDLEIMELSHALRLPPQVRGPYLSCDGMSVASWRGQLHRSEKLSVGLCWHAGDWDDARSLPLAHLAQALNGADLTFINLQDGTGAEEAAAQNAPPFFNREDDHGTIEQTAALIAAVDLVITVDTMVAHLAGALARPTWLLLKADADWRWMRDLHYTPWYSTMRLYRQKAPGDWGESLGNIRKDLETLLARRSHKAGE